MDRPAGNFRANPFINKDFPEEELLCGFENFHKAVFINEDSGNEPETEFFPKNFLGIEIYIKSKILENKHCRALNKKVSEILYSMEGVFFDGERLKVSRHFADKKNVPEKLSSLIEKSLNDFCRYAECQINVSFKTEESQFKLWKIKAPGLNEKPLQKDPADDKKTPLFYSCNMCQSLTPDHICIITPERQGMCGGLDYRDAQLMYDINKYGPCQKVIKGISSDEARGSWEGINNHCRLATFGKTKNLCLYSITEYPPLCSSLCETFALLLPESNGVIVLDRKYRGDTPAGLNFDETMALIQKHGQIPGITGQARNNLLNSSFLKAHGGSKRIAWMPKITKFLLKNDDSTRAFADETICTGINGLMAFLRQNNNELLEMEKII